MDEHVYIYIYKMIITIIVIMIIIRTTPLTIMNHNGIDDRKQSFCSLWDDKDLNKKNKDSNTKHAILRKQMGPDILNYVVNPKPSTIYYIPNEF